MQFNKVAGIVLGVLLTASVASASYTSATLATGPEAQSDGNIHYIAVFSGQGEQDVKQDVLIAPGTDIQTALRDIADKLNHTKSKDNTLPAQGTVFDVRPASAVEPTPDEVAYTKFQGLVITWRALQIKATMGSATQPDIEAAWAVVIAEYDKVSAAQGARYDQLLVVFGKGI